MELSRQDQIWNRAALELGGSGAREGDSALAALLLLHGAAMNGGISHAVEILSAEQFESALSGFRYFGLDHAANVLVKAKGATEQEIERLDSEYGKVVPNDNALVHAFRVKLLSSPQAFAPLPA